MVDDRVPADARYSDADDRAAAAMVYDETAVHRLARELDHRHIDRGARVQFRNADGRSRTAGGRYGLVDPAHVQYDSRRLSAGEARGCDGLCRSRHYVRAGDRPDRGGSPDRIFNMALHLLALAAVFGHRAVDRAEVFGKRHRRYEAPHRSAVRHIVHDRLWRRRLRLQQGRRRRRRLDQRDRGHIDRYRAGSARAVHVAADVYARADDEPARLQVPDVLSGAAYGAVVYDDYFVEHDYSADVSAERHETFRVRRRAHAAAGQRAERHPVAAHGAFVRQIWAEVARHSRPRRRCSDVMVFLRHYAASSVGFIVALHIGLMVGISMVWMPAQTNGLNQLPPELYPHGTAVMNTLQQVAGAIGTAIAISILMSGMENYLHDSPAPTELTEMANAMTLGSQNVFLFAMIVTLIGLATAFFIRRVVVNHASMNPMH